MKVTNQQFSKTPAQHPHENVVLDPQERNSLNQKIKQYRNLIKDNSSPDYIVQRRIEYLENLCRNVIRAEIKKLQ